MKYISLLLLLILAVLQYQLWFDKGGWYDKLNIEKELSYQKQQNEKQKTEVDAMRKEVENLESGGNALFEVARANLGYISKGETFYRISED